MAKSYDFNHYSQTMLALHPLAFVIETLPYLTAIMLIAAVRDAITSHRR